MHLHFYFSSHSSAVCISSPLGTKPRLHPVVYSPKPPALSASRSLAREPALYADGALSLLRQVKLVNGNLSPTEGPPARPCLPHLCGWGPGHPRLQHCHLCQGPCCTCSHTSRSKQGMNKKPNARSSLCPHPSPRRREPGLPLPTPEPCFKLKNKPVYIVENFS